MGSSMRGALAKGRKRRFFEPSGLRTPVLHGLAVREGCIAFSRGKEPQANSDICGGTLDKVNLSISFWIVPHILIVRNGDKR